MSQTIIVIRSSYTEAQKRASYKWNQMNQERVREYKRKHYELSKNRSQPFHELCAMFPALEHPEFKAKRKYTRRTI